MKRILMRAGMSPLSSVPAWKVLTNNHIGNNLGNLLFPYSLFRTLTLEDVQIDTQKTEKKFSRKDIARFNQEYDCLILPYANAFRRSFKDSLKVVTRLVWQLHIPCIVTGVGFQRGTKDTWKDPELDRIVKAFMKAVLHKSALVGVRGEGTAEYLKGLGFVPEKHFTVIGCPSMFMHGEQLPEWKKMGMLDERSKISFNSKIQLPQKFHDFIYREMQKYPEYHYVAQVREEMMMMYAGVPYPKKFCKKRPENFPTLASDELYRSGHGISFVNVPTWLKYLSEQDFSVGSRIHGNIAALQAGIPAFVIVSDERIRELVEYHHIPHIMMDELGEETTVLELYQRLDEKAYRQGHEKRFAHYLDFLHQNGLETVYDGTKKGQIPFDRQIQEVELEPPLEAFFRVDAEEQTRRIDKMIRYYRDR